MNYIEAGFEFGSTEAWIGLRYEPGVIQVCLIPCTPFLRTLEVTT